MEWFGSPVPAIDHHFDDLPINIERTHPQFFADVSVSFFAGYLILFCLALYLLIV